jgi:hypothetical protein
MIFNFKKKRSIFYFLSVFVFVEGGWGMGAATLYPTTTATAEITNDIIYKYNLKVISILLYI